MVPDTVSRLPVFHALPEICAALEKRPRAVLQAAPGAGKTSTVPLALLDAPWVQGRQIWMLEPRRLAAQAAARRLAQNIGDDRVGERVGLVTRDHRLLSKRTRIVVLTEGVLTQRLQQEPELDEVAAVIFDEFHERSLQADLGLALCREVQDSLRPDLRLLLMSATLDGAGLAQAIDAHMISCPGRQYPLTIRHRMQTLDQALDTGLRQLLREVAAQPGGSVLVFLPGEGEIRRAMTGLEGCALPVFPLFARLGNTEQREALDSDQRRVILATAVAETSLTIQGVDTVIDTGWARYPEFDPVAGYSRLVTRRVTRAQADQRAGRAGRSGPGQVWRLWNSEELLADALAPEIERVDLGRLVLELARWGSTELPWLEAPHAGRLAQARELLQWLDVIDERGTLTARGQVVARLPADPRWGVMLALAQAASPAVRQQLVGLASLLSADQPLPREPVDVEALYERLQQRRLPAALCRETERRARRFERLLGASPSLSPETSGLLAALVASFPDRIAQQRGGRGRFRFSGGGGARLPESHPLADAAFLVVMDVDGGREGVIRRALPLTESALMEVTQQRQEVVERLEFDAERGRVVRSEQRRLGALVLSERVLPVESGADVVPVLLQALRGPLWAEIPWSPALLQLRARVALLRSRGHAELPDCEDAALRAEVEDWLGPFLIGVRGVRDLSEQQLGQALDYRLGGSRAQVDRLAPARVTINGKQHRLDYRSENAPVLAAPVQWFYGLAEGPSIDQGRHPVCLHLLNPAQRPLAVTRDLRSFWSNAWREVRGQMRSRYPKHDWPEDPEQAALPERFARFRD